MSGVSKYQDQKEEGGVTSLAFMGSAKNVARVAGARDMQAIIEKSTTESL